jgi:transposase
MDRKRGLRKPWQGGRRKRALELKQHGWKPCEIAAALDVSAAAVRQRVAETRGRGSEAWRAKPRRPGPITHTPDQPHLMPELLSHGAPACGEFGTCARVATMIWEEFGVSYTKAHVSPLLRRFDWRPQLPIAHAAQRDEAMIKQWRLQEWPELKKRHVSKGEPWSFRMQQMNPFVRIRLRHAKELALNFLDGVLSQISQDEE